MLPSTQFAATSRRRLAAALLSLVVLHLIPGQPAAPGLISWFLLTGRSDLAPPPR